MNKHILHILKKGKITDCSIIEKQEMLSLFHRQEIEFIVKEKLMEDLQSETSSDLTLPDFKILFNKLWEKIEQPGKQQGNKVIALRNVIKVAAAIIMGLVIGVYATYLKTNQQEPAYYAAHSPKGSVSEMLLPDGTIIFLNAESHIKYSIEGENGIREVFLEGEAWFDVTKNNKKPFIVHTAFYDVNVTGTQFNVKAYQTDNEVTTTLEEGQIIIQSVGNFKLANNVVLNPGEQVVLNKESNELTVKKVNTGWFTSWKDNKLIFVNMNLRDLIVLLERKYGVDIEVKNKEILDLHFDGTIKNESIIEFLDIVQETLPINYNIVGQKIEITNYKN